MAYHAAQGGFGVGQLSEYQQRDQLKTRVCPVATISHTTKEKIPKRK
jgi:hypothetical protein